MNTEAVLDLLSHSPEEGYTAAEIAEELDLSKKAVGVYLAELRSGGRVERRPGDGVGPPRWSVGEAVRDTGGETRGEP